jgi:hypothetical protein
MFHKTSTNCFEAVRLPQHVSPEAVREENPPSLSDGKSEFTRGNIKKPPDKGLVSFCNFNL